MKPWLHVITCAIVAFFAAPTRADAAEDPIAGWVTHPLFNTVQQLAEDYRVEVIPPDGGSGEWRAEELSAIRAGAAALPTFIIDQLAGPIRLRRVHQPCLFGMGRYTQGCPTYDDDGNFLIYDLPPIQGEGPVQRLTPLNAAERAQIQYRRAAVHAIVLAFDQDAKWSQERRWKEINGWRTSKQPFNRDLWAYSRYLGYRSPRLDLVTFAEEWFVRPEDVIDPSRRDAVDRDLAVDCQEFTKTRFLAEKVALRDPSWHPDHPTSGDPRRRCPAFEKWARLDQIEGIDLLNAAATAASPESLYGHLLLHVRYADRADGFEPVFQFGAVTDTNVRPMTYFSRGLLGGFLSVMEVNSFRSVDRIFLQYEQRSLRHYELRLSPRQTQRLMERIWEYERRYRYPYHFFANNCASFLIDLIGPALELDVPPRGRVIVSPTDVLDFLAEIENPGRGPLLVKRPRTEYSSREVAQQSIRVRTDQLERLLAAANLTTNTARTLRRLDAQVDHRDPDLRRAAYEKIEVNLVPVLRGTDEDVVRLAIEYLYHCSRIERYFAEVAFFRTREVKAGAVAETVNYTAEELLSRRRELYRTEDPEKRFELLLAWTEDAEKRNFEGPFREFTPREQRALVEAEKMEAAYIAALDAQAAIIETHLPDFDGVAFLDAREQRFRQAESARDARATGPSGAGRISIGGTATSTDLQSISGGVQGSYAFIYERLGEQRRRGFRPDIESRALGVELHVPVLEEFWRNLDADFTLLRFLSLEQKLGPVRQGFFDLFGYGLDIRGHHDGRRGLDFAGAASLGLLLPVLHADRFANHLVIGAMADVRVDLGAQGRRIMGGGDAFVRLLLHLGGVYANSLRLEVGSRHWFALETVSYEFEHRLRLSTEHALFHVGQHPFVLSPWLQGEFTSVDYLTDDDFFGARAGLSVELPL